MDSGPRFVFIFSTELMMPNNFTCLSGLQCSDAEMLCIAATVLCILLRSLSTYWTTGVRDFIIAQIRIYYSYNCEHSENIGFWLQRFGSQWWLIFKYPHSSVHGYTSSWSPLNTIIVCFNNIRDVFHSLSNVNQLSHFQSLCKLYSLESIYQNIWLSIQIQLCMDIPYERV